MRRRLAPARVDEATGTTGRLRRPNGRLDSEGSDVMSSDGLRECYDVVVIGGGQAGLATGYHLAKRGSTS